MTFSLLDQDLAASTPGITLSNGRKTANYDGSQLGGLYTTSLDSNVFADGTNTGVAAPGSIVEFTLDTVGSDSMTVGIGFLLTDVNGILVYQNFCASYNTQGVLVSSAGSNTQTSKGATVPTSGNGTKVGFVAYTQAGNSGTKNDAIRLAIFINGTKLDDVLTANGFDYTQYGYNELIWRAYAVFAGSALPQQVSVETDPSLMTNGNTYKNFKHTTFNAIPNIGWQYQPPLPKLITSGVEKTFSATVGTPLNYKISVPAGNAQLTFEFNGDTGSHFDYYVKFGSQPTTSSYDRMGDVSGQTNNEEVFTATSGDWFILLNPLANSTGYIEGTYSPPNKYVEGILTTAGIPVANKQVSILLRDSLYSNEFAQDNVTTESDGSYKYQISPTTATNQAIGQTVLAIILDETNDGTQVMHAHVSFKTITTDPT